MRDNGPEKPLVDKAGKHVSAERVAFPWPWGVVALAVLALGWVGMYLLWNGIQLVFGL